VLVLVVPNTGGEKNVAPDPNGPSADIVEQGKPRKTIPPEARRVAGTFILTAGQRRHLEQAWPLAGPAVRQGMTYKQWLTGNIAAGRVFGGIKTAPMSIDAAEKDSAMLQILVTPQDATVKPAFFTMRLDRVGKGAAKHWVVNEFQEWNSVAIKSRPDAG
jgi:hypothetical protein